MQYKQLGKTRLKVSEIAIGTEHLGRCSQKVIDSVFRHSVDNGFNYFDILTGLEPQRIKFGNVIKDIRNKILITGHLYSRTRDPIKSKELFDSFLKQLNTDYVDVLFIQFVDKEKDYDVIINNGLYELAEQYKKKGMARYIGISGHKTEVAVKAVKSGLFDVIMHPVNLATSAISKPFRRGFTQGDGKDELLKVCIKKSVGFIAIKAFWGGKLLKSGQYYTATPEQCIHYCLSQIGVDIALAGVSSVKEVDGLLAYYKKSQKEKDYSSILASQSENNDMITGCIYCNHCLPCPQNIDIALINKFHDEAKFYFTKKLKEKYNTTSPNASDCIECGECVSRCPFNMDAIAKMKETVEMFK